MVKSVFADGTIDVYKGKRAVTAGYRVTIPTYRHADGQECGGYVLMGHSLTPELAHQSGMNAAMNVCTFSTDVVRSTALLIDCARRYAMPVPQFKRYWLGEREKFRAAVKIEVVGVSK